MQNYGQPPGYQRPGSTTSFAGQQTAPPPPTYGGYQSAGPQAQSQWAAPIQNQAPNQQWNQPQQPLQAAGGYNPGTYGAMPLGQQPSHAYPPPQHDQPPPPPPKPYGFAGAVQQQQQQNQTWAQQPQQNPSFTPQQQGGYPVQGGAQGQGATQQSYNHAAPPPPSATPEGSYFPPPQGGRPGSMYGANQVSSYPNPPSAGPQQPSTVVSPNEQQPAYIPPSLTGQGVQAYMPSNTNPMPGVYVPPPPDIPAWQQAQHAPLQGGIKKFKYTKATVDPNFYAQGYQGVQPMQQPSQLPPRPHEQFGQSQPFGQPTPHQPLPAQNQYPPQSQPQGQFGQHPQSQQQPYSQPMQPQGQFQEQPPHQPPYNPNPQVEHVQQPAPYPQPTHYGGSSVSKPFEHMQGVSNMSKPFNQRAEQNLWSVPASTDQTLVQHQQNTKASYETPQQVQQPQWQPVHYPAQSSLGSLGNKPYSQETGQDLQAPKPLGRTDTAPLNLFNQPSPQSQPVSPINNRHSMSFGSGQQTGLGRTGSVSSIAIANLHAQREGNTTSSPRPAPPKLPTPPPPRDDKSKFSVLGSGGPSDWEHFGADADIDDEELFAKKTEPAQLDSVELPASVPELNAGPSPPSTHGWPSPATHPATLNASGRADTYQPTPPPAIATLAERPSSPPLQQSFIMADAAPAPLRYSPKPVQGARPPSTQQSFAMGNGAWVPQKPSTPAQQQSQHEPPPASQGFVMDVGGWGAHSAPAQARQQTPVQQQQQLPPVATTGYVAGDGVCGASQRTPTQAQSSWEAQVSQDHPAELKERDEALERLQVNSDKEMAGLRAEIEKLKADIATASIHAADEMTALHEQIEAMKVAAEKAKTDAEAASKEKDLTIERLREDVEGKEHNIEERDAIIADLRRQLEAEKTKEHPKLTPVPADLIPDLDRWYAGSLERYVMMLRGEASEPHVEDKIKTFKAFLKAESTIRGIEYFDAPPQTTIHEQVAHALPPQASNMSKPFQPRQDIIPQHVLQSLEVSDGAPGASNPSKLFDRRQELNVQVPHESSPAEEEDYDYSPGGRPVLQHKATIPSHENVTAQQQINPSTRSSTILTPTSSVDDDSNKTPVQSPPEEQPQPQYKAYVPPVAIPIDSAPPSRRETLSFSNIPAVGPPSNSSKNHDEIFFGGARGREEKSMPTTRSTSSDSTAPDVAVPAPLSFPSNRPVSTASSSRKDPSDTLADLLPALIAPTASNHFVLEVKAMLERFKHDTHSIDELTKAWEKSASLIRKKNDNARRKRQEENEENNDDAFNNNELSYADLNVLEQEFKQKEGELKAQEDREEYKSYVEAVFDQVYNGLQTDIKALMDLYIEAENLLHTSVSGVRSLEGGDAPSTSECLVLLKDLHELILERQEKVVQAVAERDKRYKKTEIQPLYASGNIAKMKTVEKHFENAEKQAMVRAKRDRAKRIGGIVSVAEEAVVNAVGVEQHEIDAIIATIRDLEEEQGDANLLARAHDTLTHLKSSSKSLLGLLNTLEIELNAAVVDADITQAKADNVDAAHIQELENEKAAKSKKIADEYERRVKVLEHDKEEIEMLIEGKSGVVGSSEEREKEKRLKAALEEAKRRNGDA